MKTCSIYLSTLLFCLSIIGCNKDNDDSTLPSNEANITALTFQKPKKSEGKIVKEAFGVVFQISENLIENADSLPYKTDVDSLYPTFLPSNRIVTWKNGEEYESLNDETLWDFSQKNTVYFVKSTALDQITSLDYEVRVKVHQVDPDSIIWTQYPPVGGAGISYAKAIVKDDVIYYFVTQDAAAKSYKSGDGKAWTPGASHSYNITDIVLHNGQFYGLKEGVFCSSADGSSWTENALTFDNLLFSLGGNLVAVKDGKILTVNTTDFSTRERGNDLPADFPTGNIQTCVLRASSGIETGYVIDGANSQIFLMDSWDYLWSEYSDDKPFTSRSLASMVVYDQMFWVVGGGEPVEASSSGFIWQKQVKKWQPQTDNINLQNQSAVVFGNSIFVIGTDGIWEGRMNKMNFDIR